MKNWILYEDNHILIVNKPPKIPVQGDKTGDTTLLDLGKEYIKKTIYPTKIIDLYGAGDAFCGSAISCIQKELPLKYTLDYALSTSSLIAEVKGSIRSNLTNKLITDKIKKFS